MALGSPDKVRVGTSTSTDMNYLPSWHYASRWPIQEQHRPASELTELGICYIQASGPEKEELNLELLRAFHTYLYKYLDMRKDIPTSSPLMCADMKFVGRPT